MQEDTQTITRPIFLFGCSNSGTTILWQALKKHHGVSGPDLEGQDLEGMPRLLTHFLGKATFRLWAHPKFKLAYYATEKDATLEDEARVKSVFGKYLVPGTRLIAKSPADTLRARLLQAYFPDAYFVGIVRNGYAVAEGIIRKRKHDPERPQFAGLFTSVIEAAEQWFRANVILVSLQQFLKHFLIIRYEDLVADPAATLGKVARFCDLDVSTLEIPSFEQGKNDEQIAHLSAYDQEVIARIAGPMLLHFQYEILSPKLEW